MTCFVGVQFMDGLDNCTYSLSRASSTSYVHFADESPNLAIILERAQWTPLVIPSPLLVPEDCNTLCTDTWRI